MSMSSSTTLISPTSHRSTAPPTSGTTAGAGSSSTAHPNPNPRRPSTHGVKRRPSSHAAHGHHSHSGNRRSSEGEHGRRALAAGLAMHALDTTDAVIKKKKEKRPLAKNSRSDTHLPRLSRTTSMTSNTSDVSHTSHHEPRTTGRPRRGSHKKSEESVQILDGNGEEGEEVEENEEGWEESNDDDQQTQNVNQDQDQDQDQDQLEISHGKSRKGKSRASQAQAQSSNMRRTVSDTSAEPQAQGPTQNQQKFKKSNGVDPIIGNLQDSPLNSSNIHHLTQTQKTTGFAGTVQPTDPQVIAQLPIQDPHPIVTPHPIRRNTSAKSLVGPISMEPTTSTDSHSTTNTNTNNNRRQPSTSRERGGSKDRSSSKTRPEVSSRLRSTEGSGLPQASEEQDKKGKTSTSPSYPFPQMTVSPEHVAKSENDHEQQPTSDSGVAQQPEPEPETGNANHSAGQRERQVSLPQPQSQNQSSNQGPGPSRTRQASQPHPQLRHRYSNSSLRSIQSLRAPPHPLNSPTGYRTHATTATSRPGSMFGSPTKEDKRQRVPSMHQPPVPQPQVSYELAKGKGWDEPIPEGDVPRRGASSQGVAASGNRGTSSTIQSKPQPSRKDSISSTKSMRSIFAPLATPALSSPARSSSGQGVAGGRRKTAIEAASEASKMSSTNDPQLYHNSLGHSSNIPETVYLISRFLPQNKKTIKRPKWEMDMRDPNNSNLDDNDDENEEGNGMKVGLTNGDYRESHESLIRTIKNLGVQYSSHSGSLALQQQNGPGGGIRNNINRSYSSGYSLLSTPTPTLGLDGDSTNGGLGSIIRTTKDGHGLTAQKGFFNGKTPFEMSVQRCLAQRPGGGTGIGF